MPPCLRPVRDVALLLLAAMPAWGWGDDDDDAVALGQIVVTSTRTPGLIRDEPLRVEAVPTDEIEENLTVQPGNLSSLLNELAGVRVQSIAPGLGGAGLQLRGMPTRYTLVLSDGLPLLGVESGSLGLLQTPPLDLAHVEVIKGASSAAYGGGPLGGVLNLVSQTAAADSTVLANVNSRGGRDLEGFFTAGGPTGWSGTLTAGAHDQSREDVGGEGWADIAGYHRYTVRPRAWWNAGADQSLFVTAALADEYREGGTLPGRALPGGETFADTVHTQRLDGGVVGHWRLSDVTLTGTLSVTSTHLDDVFGTERIASTEGTVYAEGAVRGTLRDNAWVFGLAYQHDALSAAAVKGIGYSYGTPGLFAQDELSPASWLKLSASARIDDNNDYGTFVSPRFSALIREPGSAWSVRTSVGGGYAAPTPFVDEVEATSLGSLLPLHGLHAERAVTESLDAKWTDAQWEVNIGVFDSDIRNPLTVQGDNGNKLQIFNAPGPRRAPGAELLIHYVVGPLHAIGSWSRVDATEATLADRRQSAPLVPRQSGELGALLESKDRGRVGLEVGYTGRQALEDDPYRSMSEPYFELNALGEIRFGRVSIFLNAINLTNVRQTRFDPLVRPDAGLGGNPITEVWAPLEGRMLNIGIRAEL
jgi:iron complex outermembrane receptor protein